MSQIVGLTATWQDKVEGNPMGAGTASNAKVNTTQCIQSSTSFYESLKFSFVDKEER